MIANRKISTLLVFFVLVYSISLTCVYAADKELKYDKTPFLGVRVSDKPTVEITPLFAKHLQIKPGQGLRIINVACGSAAAKAGVRRDDIIISCNGIDIDTLDKLHNVIVSTGVGKKMSVDIICNGKRRSLNLTVGQMGKTPGKWKYPPEPIQKEVLTPGKIYLQNPITGTWDTVAINDVPLEMRQHLQDFIRWYSEYDYIVDGKKVTVTINGNPNEKASVISVYKDKKCFQKTVGQIDQLPEGTRKYASQALKKAKKENVDSKSQAAKVVAEGVMTVGHAKSISKMTEQELKKQLEITVKHMRKLEKRIKVLQQKKQKKKNSN